MAKKASNYCPINLEIMEIAIFNQNNHFDVIDQFEEVMLDAELKFFASDMLLYGFNNMHEIDQAIERARQICETADIPVRNNFKSIYLSNNGEVFCDCKLSNFSRKLVMINADASLPLVAQFQIELLKIENK